MNVIYIEKCKMTYFSAVIVAAAVENKFYSKLDNLYLSFISATNFFSNISNKNDKL